jgi:hypothetical protein
MPLAGAPIEAVSLQDLAAPASVGEALPAAALQTHVDVGDMNAAGPVMCDGSVYDKSKPHLLVTLGNHSVEPLQPGGAGGFDATCNRIISTVSTHDRCGVIVASERHAKALQCLGYPVVAWGQTVAFPMDSAAIARMGTQEPHSGSLTVHSFHEPKSMHNQINVATGEILGDGSYDGPNHLAGAYIPLALALKCSAAGDTHVNLETTNSALKEQRHTLRMVLGSNFKSLCFADKTGGSYAADGEVIVGVGAAESDPDLVVTKAQVRPGFDALVQEMSWSKDSYSTKFVDHVSATIGNGIFQKYDLDLETEIRRYASSRLPSSTGSEQPGETSADAAQSQGLHIDLCQLSAKLQLDYCSSSMVGMQQPLPIAAPTVIVNPPGVGSNAAQTDARNEAEAAKYGDRFATCSYALEPHYKLEVGRDIHPFVGIVSLTHALFLGQISAVEAERICMPFAKLNARFRCCATADCSCAEATGAAGWAAPACAAPAPTQHAPVATAVSSRFERMLSGVSQNLALSSSAGRDRKPGGVSSTARDAAAAGGGLAGAAARRATEPCTAKTYAGTCKCLQCHNATRMISLAQLVTSCTHAFQKCDNYVSDQTVHAVDERGVPQYTGTESMLPYGTAIKSCMFKTGPGGPMDTQVRVGMNTDDCENCAFQGKAIMETLLVGANCVSAAYFKPAAGRPAGATASSAREADATTIRRMRLHMHSAEDQRRILFCAEVMGEKVKVNLGFFITGSASQSNDTKSQVQQLPTAAALAFPGAAGAASASTGSASVSPPPSYSTVTSTTSPAAPRGMLVELPATVGSGTQAFGSKPSGRRLAHGTGPTTASEAPESSYSGHCTTTLSIMRDDKHMHTHISEGTGYVLMGKGDIPCEVYHRGELSPGEVADKDIGYFTGPINTDHAVDVTMKALLSSHVTTINSALSIEGANMRPCMFMGTSMHIEKNMGTFYKKIVSAGMYQCVQATGKGTIAPGADTKTFVNQRVLPVIPISVAAKGPQEVYDALGGASCGMVEVAQTDSAEHIQFETNCKNISRALSPLRLGIKAQDEHCLSKLGALKSLHVKFPEDQQLKQKYGNTRTFFVTHVVHDESAENYGKVFEKVAAKAKQKNSVFINVRFAEPVVTASKEIIQFWRLYGAPYDETAV